MKGLLREQWARTQILAYERRYAWLQTVSPADINVVDAMDGAMEEGMVLGLMLATQQPAMAQRLLAYILSTNEAPYTAAQLDWVANG
jgi:hypothetical protein